MRPLALLMHIVLAIAAFGQSNELIIEPKFKAPGDMMQQSNLVFSLRGFLAQKEQPASENKFVLPEDAMAMQLLLDELNETNYAQPHLETCRQGLGGLLVVFDYFAKDVATGIFVVLAKPKGLGYTFSVPLLKQRFAWQQREAGNYCFYYRMSRSLNDEQFEKYVNLAAAFDRKLRAPPFKTEIYCCDDFSEALLLIGVNFKAAYAGRQKGILSTRTKDRALIVDGACGGDFHEFDPHDLWHDRLHNVISPSIINRPIDEGCAYLYGGSWGMSWDEILTKFKGRFAGDPKTDWLSLYQANYDFGETKAKHLIAGYVMNALIAQKIEKEKGFEAVIPWLTCGRYQKGNDNYFAALEKVAGINRANFNEEIWKLVK